MKHNDFADKKNFLPNFCSLKMLLAVVFLSEFLAVLSTLAADYSEWGFLSEFALRSLLALWIILPSTALLCGLKNFFTRLHSSLVGLLAFLIIQLVCLLMIWLVVTVLPAWDLLMPLIEAEQKINFYLRILGFSALTSIVFLRYLYVLFQWQQQTEAKATAKLHALQARMRPHFLFNSLNTIASLTRINPPLAEALVENLAELIRANMQMDEALLVSLEQEIHLVKLYLTIETERLEERLQVNWQLDALPQDALIPPLSLQPLVENAVYYGIEPNSAGGEIVVSGELIFNRMFIRVTNPRPVSSNHQRVGNQIALQNLADRLAGCFDGDATLKTKMDETTYQVILEIPYRT